MGLIRFQPSQFRANAPEIIHYPPEASATFAIGAPLQRDSNPEFVEEHAGGSTVTGIVGTALGPSTSGSPAIGDKVPVAMADTTTLWLGQVYDVSGSAVATAAVGTHEGVQFGMIKVGNDWYVDEEDASNVVLRVIKVLPKINAVLFRWIDTAIDAS